ncbi:MAG: glycosyltransferase [Gemmatimonadota bacterium]
MKLLVLNCHEAWVHQLGALRAELEIVVGLPGRYTRVWDACMRPLPAEARTVTLDEVRLRGAAYDCVINHNITDLLDTKFLDAPKLLVLHDTLEGRMAQQEAEFDARDMRASLNSYLGSVGGHAVAITRSKAKSWGVTHTVVSNSADPDAYLPWVGDVACGLRVANHVTSKRVFLAWDFHEAAMDGVPLRLVGHNPDMPGVDAADSWDQLKRIFASHRFFVHTADPRYEDGYNMAVLEAMAAGMPILTNRHPTTIVEHGVSGYIADSPDEMRHYAERLLADRDHAEALGEKGRAFVARHHSPDRFRVEFSKAIQEAQKKWSRRRGKAMVPRR